jgi:ABC-type branched-subunit amino acid transport system ATPase component
VTPATPAAAVAPVLEVASVSKRFGGLQALDSVDLSLQPGRVHALIGPNGAGKSTMLDIICGFTRPSAGRVRLRGRDATGWPPHRIARAGVARTFQTPSLFGQMTAVENVLAGLVQGRPVGLAAPMPSRGRGGPLYDRAAALLSAVGLEGRALDEAEMLPYGQRRLLEIARGLARDPAVLLMDEPAAGLSDVEVETLKPLIRGIAARGVAVLLIEHNIPFVLETASQVAVLNFGRMIFTGTPQEAINDPEVLAAYLGREEEADGTVP